MNSKPVYVSQYSFNEFSSQLSAHKYIYTYIQQISYYTICMVTQAVALVKKITLYNFRSNKSNKFKVWKVTTKAILKLYKVLEIINSSDPNLIPCNSDSIASTIPPGLCMRVAKCAEITNTLKKLLYTASLTENCLY